MNLSIYIHENDDNIRCAYHSGGVAICRRLYAIHRVTRVSIIYITNKMGPDVRMFIDGRLSYEYNSSWGFQGPRKVVVYIQHKPSLPLRWAKKINKKVKKLKIGYSLVVAYIATDNSTGERYTGDSGTFIASEPARQLKSDLYVTIKKKKEKKDHCLIKIRRWSLSLKNSFALATVNSVPLFHRCLYIHVYCNTHTHTRT